MSVAPPTPKPEHLGDPACHASGEVHVVWRWMRENAPVYRHNSGTLPSFWSVTRYEDVRAVYMDPSTFSSAQGVLLRPVRQGADPAGGLTLALTDPPRHRKLRALVADPFSMRRARSLESVIRQGVRATLARAIEHGECDFAHDVGARLAISIVALVLGVPDEDFELLFAWTEEAFAAQRPLAAHAPIMRYFIDLMFDRRASPRADVAGLFATGVVDGQPLNETEILLNFENLVGATENAGLSVASGMQALLEYPDQWRRLREDGGLLSTAVEEVLRWASSATHSMRTATRPCVVGGHAVEPGDRVVVWLPSANRDETVFPDAFRFDIGRRPNRHLGFGIGEHACIGTSFARLQLHNLLAELIESVREVELTGPVVPLHSIAVNGPARLPVRIVPK